VTVVDKLFDVLPGIARDLAGLVGVALMVYGAWLIYPPAGYITAGLLLLVGSLLAARAEGEE
jgi:hypothetical protein